MQLPITNLRLNQSNLQDYLDCPRRFQLSVLEDTSWPAAFSEPIVNYELSTQRGNRFHLLCHQFFSGVDHNLLENSLTDPELKTMWDSFLPFARTLENYRLFSEVLLSIPFFSHRLIAKFDLIVEVSPKQYIIFDWKTASKKPSRSLLDKRLQTHLYPYIFSKVGHNIFSNIEIQPPLIKMHYWYPLASEHEEVFRYSDKKHQNFEDELKDLINTINTLIQNEPIFQLTDHLHYCQYCVFRSLCNRGLQAGSHENSPLLNLEDLTNVRFDIDQVSEIEF